MSSHENIRAIMILDIIGRPADYLVKTLEALLDEMGNEKGVTMISKEIKEPTTMKDNKEFFTTFAEVEIEVETMLHLAALMFKYMPAHIEVLSPESIGMANNEWGDILSEIVRRLHSYDEMARLMQLENEKLVRKIQELGVKVIPRQMIPQDRVANEIKVPEAKVREKEKEKAREKSKKKR